MDAYLNRSVSHFKLDTTGNRKRATLAALSLAYLEASCGIVDKETPSGAGALPSLDAVPNHLYSIAASFFQKPDDRWIVIWH